MTHVVAVVGNPNCGKTTFFKPCPPVPPSTWATGPA